MSQSVVAKNTFFLYFRMLITMFLSLFISRFVLKNLGVVDYGIYGVVGSVVTLFSFLNIALVTAGQRCIAFEFGKANPQIREVFNSIFTFCFFTAIIVLAILLVGGLGFVEKLNIPIERLQAAKTVFYYSCISFFLSTIQIPFSSYIIASERIGLYAVINVIDICLKLFVTIILGYLDGDSMINYGLLIIFSTFITSLINFIAVKSKISVGIQFSKERFIEVGKYFGWNLLGGLASISLLQGLQILLNIFFNPIVNAAQALTMQIKGAVDTFASNIRTASNPKIIKLCAAKKNYEAFLLLNLAIKLSTVAILVIAIPIFIQVDIILEMWLGKVPPYTNIFVRLMLMNCIIDVVSSPIVAVIQSIGNIRNYQILVSIILLSVLPICYLCYLLGFESYTFGYVLIVSSVLVLLLRVFFLKKLFKFSMNKLQFSIFKQIVVLPLLVAIPTFYISNMSSQKYVNLLLVVLFSGIFIIVFSLYLLFDKKEREYIFKMVNNKIKHFI